MKDLLKKDIANLLSKRDKYNYAREYLQDLILQIIDQKGLLPAVLL